MSNLNKEIRIKLVGKITLLMPSLEQKLDMQLEVKNANAIDEILYNYEIQSKCTNLVASDAGRKYLSVYLISESAIYIIFKKIQYYLHKTCITRNKLDYSKKNVIKFPFEVYFVSLK